MTRKRFNFEGRGGRCEIGIACEAGAVGCQDCLPGDDELTMDQPGWDVRSDLAEREEMSLRERAELADGLGGEQAPVAGYPSAVVVVDLQPAVLEQPPQDVFGVFEHDVADWELVQQRRVGVVPASWASCCWACSAWCCSARSSAMRSWMLSRKPGCGCSQVSRLWMSRRCRAARSAIWSRS